MMTVIDCNEQRSRDHDDDYYIELDVVTKYEWCRGVRYNRHHRSCPNNDKFSASHSEIL